MTPDVDTTRNDIERVAIIGAGFSGTIQAINLLRLDGPEAILIEREPQSGRGVAYATLHKDHVLNVRASNMSAFPDDPGHFVRWIGERSLGDGTDFVSRHTYGDYLTSLLQEGARAYPGRLTLLRDEALDIAANQSGMSIKLRSGSTVEAEATVLAIGNLPPHQVSPVAAAALDSDRYAPNPWSRAIADGLEADDDVLIIGTGLTMVDAALYLAAGALRGRIYALSRRGLLPRAHDAPGAPPPRLPERPLPLSSRLVGSVRERAGTQGWRNAVDELRPYTQTVWRSATHAQRSRFLRHLRPWWDVHRHRIAPQVAEMLAALQQEGRLTPLAGSVLAVEPDGNGVAVSWRPRGTTRNETLRVRRIINCTGPQGDLLRTEDPLLRNLIKRGMVRPDPHRLGIDVNQEGELIAADGRAQPNLLAVGPMTRGAFWEIVAVPDIRVQTWAVARRLANAHWVGGEGL